MNKYPRIAPRRLAAGDSLTFPFIGILIQWPFSEMYAEPFEIKASSRMTGCFFFPQIAPTPGWTVSDFAPDSYCRNDCTFTR